MTMRISPAAARDLDAVLALLAEASLPSAGVAEHLPDGFVVARAAAKEPLLGAAGLEVHGSVGLLRSVVVRPDVRGSGLGARLALKVLEHAAARGVREVYLLTTTAEDYFPRLGFEPVPRESLPEALHASAELRGAGPASAIAMRLRL